MSHTVWLRVYEPINATMIDRRGRKRECRGKNSAGTVIVSEYQQKNSGIRFGTVILHTEMGMFALRGMAVQSDGSRESLYEKV